MRASTTNTAPGSAGQNGAHTQAHTAPCYAQRNHALFVPAPSNPLMPWQEDPLGAVALFVTAAILIFATGIATLL